MIKRHYICIIGLSAAISALFALHKTTIKNISKQSPLEKTIKHVIEQGLDSETFRLLRAFEEYL